MTQETAIAAWNTRAPDPAIREAIANGDGIWRTCTGCYETSDGYNVNGHPHSETFGCIVGGGCGECGGIGVIWDTTDYEELARAAMQEATPIQEVTEDAARDDDD